MMHPADREPLRSVIRNVERLLSDANVLFEHGSAGSALATAILAFEEAGKGHHWELGFPPRRRSMGSWHHYRQYIAGHVMHASLFQKYNLKAPNLSKRALEIIEERWKGAKSALEVAKKPVPEEFRTEMRANRIPGLDALSSDEMLIFSVELRWVGKIIKAAAQGTVEQLRQSGMYVDLIGDAVASSPTKVRRKVAYHWMRVAERALALLRNGEYREPYGELGAVLESMPKPLPPLPDLLKMIQEMHSAGLELEAELEKAGLD